MCPAGNTDLYVPKFYPRTSRTSAINGCGVPKAIRDRTGHDKGSPVISRWVTQCTDFLLGSSEENGGLNEVLLART